jgi:hypothetical protein
VPLFPTNGPRNLTSKKQTTYIRTSLYHYTTILNIRLDLYELLVGVVLSLLQLASNVPLSRNLNQFTRCKDCVVINLIFWALTRRIPIQFSSMTDIWPLYTKYISTVVMLAQVHQSQCLMSTVQPNNWSFVRVKPSSKRGRVTQNILSSYEHLRQPVFNTQRSRSAKAGKKSHLIGREWVLGCCMGLPSRLWEYDQGYSCFHCTRSPRRSYFLLLMRSYCWVFTE